MDTSFKCEFKTNRKQSIMTLSNNGTNITRAIFSQVLKFLFIQSLYYLFFKKFSCTEEHSLKNLAIIKSGCIVSKAFDKSMNIALTYSFTSISFQISSMYIKQCCVLCFFLKLVNRFDS